MRVEVVGSIGKAEDGGAIAEEYVRPVRRRGVEQSRVRPEGKR